MILTGFQLRAARKALSLTLAQLSEKCGVIRNQLNRLERDTDKLDYIKSYPVDIKKLYNFFTKNNLIFPSENIISLNQEIEIRDSYSNIAIPC